jgi:hypothetical protein
MQCRRTFAHSRPSGPTSRASGGGRSGDAAKRIASRGPGLRGWPMIGSPNPASFIPGLAIASPSTTQGGSRMRESRTYGSVRGAPSNGRPYRDPNVSMTKPKIWVPSPSSNDTLPTIVVPRLLACWLFPLLLRKRTPIAPLRNQRPPQPRTPPWSISRCHTPYYLSIPNSQRSCDTPHRHCGERCYLDTMLCGQSISIPACEK